MKLRTLLMLGFFSIGFTQAYTVQKGDTLYSIAKSNGIKVDELVLLNDIKDNTISVGQVLRLSGKPDTKQKISTTNTGLPATKLPPPLLPEQLSPINTKLDGVEVSIEKKLTMGEAFIIRLKGARAAEATVNFPSEIGEDVRMPNELLHPEGAAGEYRVLGRLVLGKVSPLVYEVKLGDQLLRGSVDVSGLSHNIQYLNLPPKISNVLKDDGRAAEEATVETAYALRTPQVWSKPFEPPLSSKAINSSFGQPRVYTKGGNVAYHYGMDYPASTGTAVSAINDGTVVIAGTYPVRGNLVVIDHGAGLVSLYFHQSKILVKVGDKVRRGQNIGLVGSTGLSSGSHLHLEMRVRGEAVNPLGWFSRLWPR